MWKKRPASRIDLDKVFLAQDRAPSSPLKTWGLKIGKRSSTPPAATYNSV